MIARKPVRQRGLFWPCVNHHAHLGADGAERCADAVAGQRVRHGRGGGQRARELPRPIHPSARSGAACVLRRRAGAPSQRQRIARQRGDDRAWAAGRVGGSAYAWLAGCASSADGRRHDTSAAVRGRCAAYTRAIRRDRLPTGPAASQRRMQLRTPTDDSGAPGRSVGPDSLRWRDDLTMGVRPRARLAGASTAQSRAARATHAVRALCPPSRPPARTRAWCPAATGRCRCTDSKRQRHTCVRVCVCVRKRACARLNAHTHTHSRTHARSAVCRRRSVGRTQTAAAVHRGMSATAAHPDAHAAHGAAADDAKENEARKVRRRWRGRRAHRPGSALLLEASRVAASATCCSSCALPLLTRWCARAPALKGTVGAAPEQQRTPLRDRNARPVALPQTVHAVPPLASAVAAGTLVGCDCSAAGHASPGGGDQPDAATIRALRVELDNVREENVHCRAEYERIRAEGRELFRVYDLKSKRLRAALKQTAETQERLAVLEKQHAEATSVLAAQLVQERESVAHWKAKYYTQRRFADEQLEAHRALLVAHSNLRARHVSFAIAVHRGQGRVPCAAEDAVADADADNSVDPVVGVGSEVRPVRSDGDVPATIAGHAPVIAAVIDNDRHSDGQVDDATRLHASLASVELQMSRVSHQCAELRQTHADLLPLIRRLADGAPCCVAPDSGADALCGDRGSAPTVVLQHTSTQTVPAVHDMHDAPPTEPNDCPQPLVPSDPTTDVLLRPHADDQQLLEMARLRDELDEARRQYAELSDFIAEEQRLVRSDAIDELEVRLRAAQCECDEARDRCTTAELRASAAAEKLAALESVLRDALTRTTELEVMHEAREADMCKLRAALDSLMAASALRSSGQHSDGSTADIQLTLPNLARLELVPARDERAEQQHRIGAAQDSHRGSGVLPDGVPGSTGPMERRYSTILCDQRLTLQGNAPVTAADCAAGLGQGCEHSDLATQQWQATFDERLQHALDENVRLRERLVHLEASAARQRADLEQRLQVAELEVATAEETISLVRGALRQAHSVVVATPALMRLLAALERDVT